MSMLPEMLPETEAMISDLVASVTRQAKEVLDIDPDRAAALADEVATEFFSKHGGATHYIPVGVSWRSSHLHDAVWEAYTGNNVRQLHVKFQVSMTYIYRIIKRARARDKASRQGKLPGLDQGS